MDENSPNPNLNETDLLELALRLATFPDDSRTQNAHLLPGQLPDQLPIEIPLPEGSRVLGSLIRNPESINILLDTHLSPAQVLAFYRQRLQAAGWQTPEPYRPNRGGFISSGSRSRGGYEIFYQNLRDPALTVPALESSSAWDDEGPRHRRECVFTGEGQNGPLAWNTWALREDDEQWHGFFFILKVLDQEYYLYMRMQSDNGGKTKTSSLF